MLLNLLIAQQCLLLHYPALCLKLLRTAERRVDAYPTLRRSSVRWFAKRLLERPRKIERAELHDSANWRARRSRLAHSKRRSSRWTRLHILCQSRNGQSPVHKRCAAMAVPLAGSRLSVGATRNEQG
jgi:hypothetical protein